MHKDDITQRRVFELPSQTVFHLGNAHERADGSIALRFISAPTADFVMHAALLLVAGHPASFGGSSTQPAVLDMRNGRMHVDGMGDRVVFPRVHPMRNGLLDARHIADGPVAVAQATLPYCLPCGLHGNFTAA